MLDGGLPRWRELGAMAAAVGFLNMALGMYRA